MNGSATVRNAAGQSWPFAWNFGSADSAFVQFKLSGFSTGRNVYLRFNAKRSGVMGGSTNNYSLAFFNDTTMLTSGTIGPVPSSFTASWVASGAQSFNYSGGWNQVLLSITGDGYGGLPDLMDLNWMLLEVH